MYETTPFFYGTGRRKKSIARVRVYAGSGKGTLGMAIINKGKTKPVTSVDVTALPPTEVAGKTSEQGF